MIYYKELDVEALSYRCVDYVTTKQNGETVEYLNIEAGFDIETTSTYLNGEKLAFMYIWQMGIGENEPVVYGRTWAELEEFINDVVYYFDLGMFRRAVIYVHNFPYEFQFIRKYFTFTDVFAVGARKPIRALTVNGIEFRDSLILSGYSLENTAKNLQTRTVKKLVGDLDYKLIRHDLTPLTDEEMAYCENDIKIITAYIAEQIEQYGDIVNIPMTNTGRVRRFVRDNCFRKNKKQGGKYGTYSKLMNRLTITPDDYIMLSNGFMGGFTHSSSYHTGKVLKNVASVDLSSSYPSVMLTEMFPMGRGRTLQIPQTFDELEELKSRYCLLIEVNFRGIENKIEFESYISESKCSELKNPVINNGRVYLADYLTTVITDVDLEIIKNVYKWQEMRIGTLIGFPKSYLPKPIINSIISLYKDKTQLKGVKGKEVEYLLSKGMLNSVYGMSVTNPVKDDHKYFDEWIEQEADIEEEIKRHNESGNRFLFYAWGIWVTAYARKNLWEGILNIGNDYVYSDTDSIKFLNYEQYKDFFTGFNERMGMKFKLMSDYHNLGLDELAPLTKEGIKKPIGVWELEGVYSHFKTLGAKRYLVKENGEYYMTVAGLSKRNGVEYLKEIGEYDTDKIFKKFDNSFTVPPHRTGKSSHTYIDDEREGVVVDYLGVERYVNAKTSIHLEEAGFSLEISYRYLEFLKRLSQGEIFRGYD